MDLISAIITIVIGFISALMGASISGGGIIAVPALIALGLPPHITLGTIRPSYLTGAVVSGWRYKIRGYLQMKESVFMIIPAAIGAVIGASLILGASETFTKYLIGAVVLVSVVLLLIKREAGIVKQKEKHSLIILMLIALGLGVMSGAIGVAGSTIAITAFVLIEGFTMKEALALNSVRAIGNQTAALIVFAFASSIYWDYALLLMLGSILGAVVGVEVAHKLPIKILKPIFIVAAVLLTIKFLFF